MLNGLFITSLIATGVEYVKEKFVKEVSAENWTNKELYYEDVINGIPIEQRMKNLHNGKYKQTKVYPEPHRNSNGKIIIENTLLYESDIEKYGAYQAYKWAEQGKYNLTPEELKKERERLDEEYKRLYSY